MELLCDKKTCTISTGELIGSILIEYVKPKENDEKRIEICDYLNGKGFQELVNYMSTLPKFCYVLSFLVADTYTEKLIKESDCYTILVKILKSVLTVSNTNIKDNNKDIKSKLNLKNVFYCVSLLGELFLYYGYNRQFLNENTDLVTIMISLMSDIDEDITKSLLLLVERSIVDYSMKLIIYKQFPVIIQNLKTITLSQNKTLSELAIEILKKFFKSDENDNKTILNILSINDLFSCFYINNRSISVAILDTFNNRLTNGSIPPAELLPWIYRKGFLFQSNNRLIMSTSTPYLFVVDENYIYQYKYFKSPPIAKYRINNISINEVESDLSITFSFTSKIGLSKVSNKESKDKDDNENTINTNIISQIDTLDVKDITFKASNSGTFHIWRLALDNIKNHNLDDYHNVYRYIIQESENVSLSRGISSLKECNYYGFNLNEVINIEFVSLEWYSSLKFHSNDISIYIYILLFKI